MEEALTRVPDFETFRKTVARNGKKSSSGMSGYTYRMQKAMPEEVIREIYDQLSNMWQDKHIPDWWKWRWFCPIPKVAVNIGLNNLRPISLVEIMRKTWVSLIVNRISGLWNKYELIHQSQHAYAKRCGTETAILSFINMMEEAKESCTSIFGSSWDMVHAFDSPGKNILILSWVRLGVPLCIARYMVDMDTEGKTVIRTPYATEAFARKSYGGFSNVSDLQAEVENPPTYFIGERGTGQGDIPSPNNWKAFFDILLCAIGRIQTGKFLTRGKDG